jgi:hypothetical protein
MAMRTTFCLLAVTVMAAPFLAEARGQKGLTPREKNVLRAEALVTKLNLPLRPPKQALDHALRHKALHGTPLHVLLDRFRKAETKREVQDAARALKEANYDAVPLLIVEVLDNKSPLHRKYAAEALGLQNVHLQALPALLKAHKEDPDADVRDRAGDMASCILSWFEMEERQLAWKQDQILRAEALVKQLDLPLRPPQHAIDYALRRAGPDGTPLHVLLDRFRKAINKGEVRAAAWALRDAGFDAVPLLIVEVLDNPKPLQRQYAAEALRILQNYLQALPALLKASKEDPDETVRQRAGFAALTILIAFEHAEQRLERQRDLIHLEERLRQLKEEENKRKGGGK